jgi:hypothetical protein
MKVGEAHHDRGLRPVGRSRQPVRADEAAGPKDVVVMGFSYVKSLPVGQARVVAPKHSAGRRALGKRIASTQTDLPIDHRPTSLHLAEILKSICIRI